jgi:hypothetical protein
MMILKTKNHFTIPFQGMQRKSKSVTLKIFTLRKRIHHLFLLPIQFMPLDNLTGEGKFVFPEVF